VEIYVENQQVGLREKLLGWHLYPSIRTRRNVKKNLQEIGSKFSYENVVTEGTNLWLVTAVCRDERFLS